MTLHRLDERPELISLLVSWFRCEWGDQIGFHSIKNLRNRLELFAQSRTIPFTLIAFRNNTPVATASVVQDDKLQKPWLTNVLVPSIYRGNGFGSYIVAKAAEEAGRFGHAKLYLITMGQAGFFARLGWQEVVTTHYGSEVTVMERRLDAPKTPPRVKDFAFHESEYSPAFL